jgi:hypothetical protein
MISNFSTPSIASGSGTGSGSGSTDKTIMLVAILLGGFLLYKFVIKPEMDKQKMNNNESSTNGQFE